MPRLTTILSLAGLIVLITTSGCGEQGCSPDLTPEETGRTWHIAPDGTGEAPTIQAGIDSAADGDTVILESGVFKGLGNRNIKFRGKAITVRSETGNPEECVINCQELSRAVNFNMGEDSSSVLCGIKMKNGDDWLASGGIYCDGTSPRIIRCIIYDNHVMTGGGAGMFCENDARPVLVDCRFELNSGVRAAGGLQCDGSSPLLMNCIFDRNSVNGGPEGGGGGVSCINGSAPALSNCVFSGNRATRGSGGVHCDSSYPVIRECTFRENKATVGAGAVHCYSSSPIITDCIFVNNRATDGAGAVYFGESSPTVSRCRFVENRVTVGAGAGHISRAHPSFVSCTFDGNTVHGGGSGCLLFTDGSTCSIVSCTFYANTAVNSGASSLHFEESAADVDNVIISYGGTGPSVTCTGAIPIFSCCDIYGNGDGDWFGCIESQLGVRGNFSAAPEFCDTRAGDFHLCDSSACLPGRHPDGYDGGLVGAWGMGCSCAIPDSEPGSW